MATEDNLLIIKKKLVEALGDKKDAYFFYLNQWFRMKGTKEDYDANARKLLPTNLIHLHNEFFLAMLLKCQLNLSSIGPPNISIKAEYVQPEEQIIEKASPTEFNGVGYIQAGNKRFKIEKQRIKPNKTSYSTEYEPVDLHELVSAAAKRDTSVLSDSAAGYYQRALYMLDAGALKGRLLICAWDFGLAGIGDNVALLLQEATKQCLRNILKAVITRRKAYLLREEKFTHSVGIKPGNLWLRSCSNVNDWMMENRGVSFGESESGQWPFWPTVDAAEQNAAFLMSCSSSSQTPLKPVSPLDLYHTLKVNRDLIPCHSVYSQGMERISSRMWHPGVRELEQETIAIKEIAVREILREQRLAANHVS